MVVPTIPPGFPALAPVAHDRLPAETRWYARAEGVEPYRLRLARRARSARAARAWRLVVRAFSAKRPAP